MLEEYKQIYTESAKHLVNYKKLNRNELANKYIEKEKSQDAEYYLSALILSFWNVILHNYNTRSYNDVTEYDAYTWVIQGILDALRDRAWLDPESSLYEDKNGPEKAINIKCFQNKCRYYQILECDKRKAEKTKLSLEGISEECSDSYFTPYWDDSEIKSKELSKYIRSFIDKKEYLKFFILDAIINGDTVSKNGLDEFQVRKFIRNIDDSYCKTLGDYYQADISELKYYLKFLQQLNVDIFSMRIQNIMRELNRDKTLRNFLYQR